MTEADGPSAAIEPIEALPGRAQAGRGAHGVAAWFGPSVTIAEVFAYLGVGFLIAAFNATILKAATGDDWSRVAGFGWLIGSVILVVSGAAIRTADARASRGAGVLFLAGLAFAGGAFAVLANAAGVPWSGNAVIAGVLASIMALGLRRFHPSVLTQVGLLWAITAAASAGLVWVQQTWFSSTDNAFGDASAGPPPILLVLGSAAWWLAVAVGLALIGLREGRVAARDGKPAAGRRAAVSRFWAGFVGVIGLASAVSMSSYDPVTREYGRTLTPWIGDVALLLLAAFLVERAFRRDATSFIYAAALGLIIALTDFNISYLSDSTEGGLIIEGLILLAVGFGADELRRRIDASGSQRPTPGPPDTVNPAEVDPGASAVRLA
jgi:hypothetical protein